MARKDGNVENVIKDSGINGHVYLVSKGGRVFAPDDMNSKWVAQIGYDKLDRRYRLDRMLNAERGDKYTLQYREYNRCANNLVSGLNRRLGV